MQLLRATSTLDPRVTAPLRQRRGARGSGGEVCTPMAEHVLVWLLVERDGLVLLTRRKATEPPFANQWVLPGEEMKEEESSGETVARVARDELGAGFSGDDFVTTLSMIEGGNSYSVNVFRVTLEGHPRYRESGPYEEAAWAPLVDLEGAGLPMPPQLLDALVSEADGPSGRGPRGAPRFKVEGEKP